ncbi:MAG TPA: fibronectin type III domain-containing protein [Actinomycetota bacterium]
MAGIIAIAVASGGGGKPTEARPSGPASRSVGSPVGLTVKADTAPIGVTLTWGAPSGKAEILGYLVYRNGTQIGSVPADTTTYTDTNVMPGETYTYGVVTRGGGFVRSERASAVVEVPVPGLAAARLEGVFDVTAKTISQSGYVGKLGKLNLGWSFHPNCHTGPCGVHWSDVTSGSLRAILARRGTTYSGTDEGKFIGRCGRTRLPSTLTIKLRVTRAEVVIGEWRAVKFVGTLKESHPAQLGCVGGGATFLIKGTLTD